MMREKRHLNDRIDIFLLLNQHKIVSEEELRDLLPNEKYEDYQKTFYKRRLIDVFKKNYAHNWFQQRYLNSESLDSSDNGISIVRSKFGFNRFEVMGEYIRIDDIPPTASESDIREYFGANENIKEIYFTYPNPDTNMTRSVYISCSNIDKESLLDQIRDVCHNKDFNISSVFLGEDDVPVCSMVSVIKNVQPSLESNNYREPSLLSSFKHKSEQNEHLNLSKKIFEVLCTIYEKDSSRVIDEYKNNKGSEDPDFIDILKHMFLYCYVCGIQYDTALEFCIGCKNHKNSSESDRRRKILAEYKNFRDHNNITIDYLLGSNISKDDENVYQCMYCDKKFSSEEFIHQHYNKKHKEEIQARDKKYENYKALLDKIDFYMISLLTGFTQPTPWFVNQIDHKKVVYDMNHIFSGNIVLER